MRHWLFPLLLVLTAAITVTVILLAVRAPQAEAPASTSDTQAQTEAVTETEPSVEPTSETETQLPPPMYASHAAYMHGFDSFFAPDRLLSRAEAAILIYRLYGGDEDAVVFFYDVPEDNEIYHEIVSVCDLFPREQYNYFRPDEPILREDFFTVICNAAARELPDEMRNESAPYTAFAQENRWCEPDETSEYVSRGEAAQIFNRVLGRSPDRFLLMRESPVIFADVSPAHPYYGDIMEASVSHEYPEYMDAEQWHVSELPKLKSGIYRQGCVAYCVQEDGTLLTAPGMNDTPFGTVYVVDETGLIYADDRPHLTPDGVIFCQKDGTILKNGSKNGYTFDENGFYTTGDAELDGYVQAIYDECTTEEMTQFERLRACYDYVRDFAYLGRNRPLDDSVQTMPYDLAKDYALKIFQTGKGDCYNFTAAFLFLARGLGYDAEGIIGYCYYNWSRNAIAHGWVTITMDDGVVYLFDPQIENYNLRAGISNEYYGAFMTTYAASHATYYPN